MEGVIGLEIGPKKGLFSLKSKKKYNAVLQGAVLTYTREGESTATGSITFTTDTIVEGSPKNKRLICVKQKKEEWDIIVHDDVSYGKWMDAIALVFRGLHVDPEAFKKMVSAGESDEPSETSTLSPSSSTTSLQASETSSVSEAQNLNASTDAAPSSSSVDGDRADSDKPTPPPRPSLAKNAGPLSTSAPADSVARSESKSDMPSKPGMPKRPDRPAAPGSGPTKTSSAALSRPSISPSGTSSPSSTNGPSPSGTPTLSSSETNSESGNAPAAAPGIPPSTSAKKLARPTAPVPSIKNLNTATTNPQKPEQVSPNNQSSGAGAGQPPPATPTHAPLSARTSSGAGLAPNSMVSPRSGTASPRSGSLGSQDGSAPISAPKIFVVWLPNRLKHGSVYNSELPVRWYLDKICKTRPNITPETFIAKTADGNVVDLDTILSKLPQPEIWWETLPEGKTMPAAFIVKDADSLASNSSADLGISPSKPGGAAAGSSKTHKSTEMPGGSDTPPVDHRTKVVREIISTEQSYVEALKLLKDHFLKNLIETVNVKPEGPIDKEKQLPPEAAIRSMIPKNFDSILGFNDIFLGELRDCPPDGIGALFGKRFHFLKLYNDYSSDYQDSLGAYNKAMRDFPAFGVKLDELRAASGSRLRLEDYIIMPVQRVPRYTLLISDLLKNTPNTHADYANLQAAEKQLADIGTFINESVRKSDGAKKLKEFEEKGVAVDRLITPSRFLVREGQVKVLEQKNKQTKHFFLFNDILVQVKDSAMTKGVDLSLPEYVWPLNLVWITDSEQTVEITGPHGAAMTIKKKKTADLTWVRDLNQRILAHIQKTDSSAISAGSKRLGTYTSPWDETYEGEWLDGLKHGFGKSTIPGSVYEGYWAAGKRNGPGMMVYANGTQYSGAWKADAQHGQGTLTMGEGGVTLYTGGWLNGSPNGNGTFTYTPSGDTYVGDIYEGRCTGQGTLTCKNGVTYSGQWKDDQFDGRGKLVSPDSGTYEGQFRSGVKAGKGVMNYLDGSQYNGEWLEGFRHGKGEYVEKDGTKYEGDWMDDRPDGKGIKTWPDKVRYEGQFSRGLRKGTGKIVYADNSKYEGNWMDDLPHLQGTYVAADGATYNGEWVFGRREGRGTYTYVSTAKYEGTWYNDRFHKSGIYLGAPSETIKSYDGEWLYGRMSNKGTLTFQNGDSFKGNFKDGRAHGAGTYTYANGATYVGKWNLGIREGKGTYTPTPSDAKAHGLSGALEVNSNTLALGPLTLFLPPQQPLFLTAPAIEAVRLHQH